MEYSYENNIRDLIVGLDTKVPLSNNKLVTPINFDNAATTPPFISVLQEINNFAPWYSSIHRGTGYKSKISSDIYDNSRNEVLKFLDADPYYYTVIYVKNTTDAINKLSNRLYSKNKRFVVLSTSMEHISNDLPWRDKFRVDYIDVDSFGRLSLKDMEKKLRRYDGDVKLVTISGASNVTGYVNPIHKAAQIAHRYNAKILVDGAQLIPHKKVSMGNPYSIDHIDFIAFSAHKMYAPFGIGVLIGPKEFFDNGEPDYKGGGTVKIVTRDTVIYDDAPEKDEAGTPNIMGVVALLAAIRTLNSIGIENIEYHERTLLKYAIDKLKEIKDIELYCDTENLNDRVAIIPFNLKDMPHETLSSILSCEAGISVRSGCFCAHPYVQRLLKIPEKHIRKYLKYPDSTRPGIVRISFGLYNTIEEIDILINLLKEISQNKNSYMQRYCDENNFKKI
ncbi:aminotransferase class V-fold PLP-dependent enzyme [Caloramator sp. E03]|uniref:aminotransferase class V-fold PLP-dependent enzyme n=1 Tax=Caloramator sp. E03 TaxID=2576307 RepID=UPI001110678F|nr:aminotransferase class V-fold PLP-dependent enzyme [Caloramator sp. E03]QCX34199.1 aminotransferase class V-fold PLP-dependent enzyme [Caloramator sp. E03]